MLYFHPMTKLFHNLKFVPLFPHHLFDHKAKEKPPEDSKQKTYKL